MRGDPEVPGSIREYTGVRRGGTSRARDTVLPTYRYTTGPRVRVLPASTTRTQHLLGVLVLRRHTQTPVYRHGYQCPGRCPVPSHPHLLPSTPGTPVSSGSSPSSLGPLIQWLCGGGICMDGCRGQGPRGALPHYRVPGTLESPRYCSPLVLRSVTPYRPIPCSSMYTLSSRGALYTTGQYLQYRTTPVTSVSLVPVQCYPGAVSSTGFTGMHRVYPGRGYIGSSVGSVYPPPLLVPLVLLECPQSTVPLVPLNPRITPLLGDRGGVRVNQDKTHKTLGLYWGGTRG